MWAVARCVALRGTQLSHSWGLNTAVRAFAAAAGEVDFSVVDLIKYASVAGKYATALATVAAEQKELAEVEKELNTVADLAASNEEFYNLLNDPTIPHGEKASSLEDLLAGSTGETIQNLLLTLVENGRGKLLERVRTDFSELMADLRGEVNAVVTTARPITEKELDQLKTQMKSLGLVGEDKTLFLETKVDPEIFGGVIFQVADKYLDHSILARIKEVQRVMLEPL